MTSPSPGTATQPPPMQAWALTVDRILEHAGKWHGEREVVTRLPDGALERSTWGRIHGRARQVSAALAALGIGPGDRVATLAMNSAQHVEAWYGVMGMGAVCHTINPRLFPDQLAYIVNHAQDRILFADALFAPLLEKLLPQCPSVERVVFMAGEASLAARASTGYEPFIAAASGECRWGGFDENTPAGLCYTSGTTGNPKGVLYTHRSNVLHTLIAMQADCMALSSQDVVLAVVPMFHANAWGLPFTTAAAGAKFVLPGPRLDGRSLYELLESEGVTYSAAVPTLWQTLLDFLDAGQLRLSTLKRVTIGGSAVPESLVRAFRDRYGVDVIQAWGMTEMSPLGTVSVPSADVAALGEEEQLAYKLRQGRVPFMVDMKITDEAGHRQPHDGEAQGRLKVRGPAVVNRYFREDDQEILDEEGFFDTGDVAKIDPHGYMQITDRAKDLIKSGGEWISSVDIENVAAGHPKAALAAVIAVPHPKWRERPLLLVKLRPGQQATREEFLAHLEGKIASWWMPDDVLFVEEIPLGATGKIDKKRLRAQYPGT
jgi:fatty-acyl-CoA synthase